LPLNLFEEFKEIDEYNEDIFEFMAYNLVITWLENCMKINQGSEKILPSWDIAVEFPDIITSEGRTKLYEIAHYFGLAQHMAGRKGKNRRCLIYPKCMFIEK
jgi:hypothetical protein